MQQSYARMVSYGAVVLGAIAVVAVVMRLNQDEAGFCRDVFRNLVNDRQVAQQQIDWEHLQAVGVDVGTTYTRLPDDQSRAQYRRAFVNNFAMGFRQVEGHAEAFRHWRIHTRGSEQVVVAVDYETKHKTLLLTLPASGRRKLEAIQWQ